MKRPRLDVNLEELDRVLDQAREAPLSEPDYDKLKSALHALAGMLAKPRSTEKTKNVLEQPETPALENRCGLRAAVDSHPARRGLRVERGAGEIR